MRLTETDWRLGGGMSLVGGVAIGLLIGFFDAERPIWSAFLTFLCVGLAGAAYFGQRYFERNWHDVGEMNSDQRGKPE